MHDVRKSVILRLYRDNCWNEKHTAYERVYRCVPSHLQGAAKKEILILIKDGLIFAKRTEYGVQLSLNVKMKEHIKAIIETFDP